MRLLRVSLRVRVPARTCSPPVLPPITSVIFSFNGLFSSNAKNSNVTKQFSSFSFHTKDKLSKQGTAKSKKNDKNARGEIYHGMMIDFLPDKLLLNHHLPSLRNLTFRFVNKHSARLTAFSITQVSRFVLHRKPSALQKSSREKRKQKI